MATSLLFIETLYDPIDQPGLGFLFYGNSLFLKKNNTRMTLRPQFVSQQHTDPQGERTKGTIFGV